MVMPFYPYFLQSLDSGCLGKGRTWDEAAEAHLEGADSWILFAGPQSHGWAAHPSLRGTWAAHLCVNHAIRVTFLTPNSASNNSIDKSSFQLQTN